MVGIEFDDQEQGFDRGLPSSRSCSAGSLYSWRVLSNELAAPAGGLDLRGCDQGITWNAINRVAFGKSLGRLQRCFRLIAPDIARRLALPANGIV